LKRTPKDQEKIFVTKNLPGIHYSTGDYVRVERHNSAWTEEVMSNSFFIERWMAEDDSSMLQFIPYVLCFHQNRILSYRRKGGGESKLDGMKSIGIGGHVNIDDKPPATKDKKLIKRKLYSANDWKIVVNGAVREVCEELYIEPDYVRENIFQVGTIYTPSDTGNKRVDGPNVGSVHLGIIYVLPVDRDVQINGDEDSMIDPTFVARDRKPKDIKVYETWSRKIFGSMRFINKILEK
jgi:predicted NUDIX family phosphoesterase